MEVTEYEKSKILFGKKHCVFRCFNGFGSRASLFRKRGSRRFGRCVAELFALTDCNRGYFARTVCGRHSRFDFRNRHFDYGGHGITRSCLFILVSSAAVHDYIDMPSENDGGGSCKRLAASVDQTEKRNRCGLCFRIIGAHCEHRIVYSRLLMYQRRGRGFCIGIRARLRFGFFHHYFGICNI